MIRFLTAGESHGPGLSSIIDGFPANVPLDLDKINHELYRRQQGYGRGGRMRIEQDKIELLSGVRFGKSMGSPIGFILRNKDWDNWTDIMDQKQEHPGKEITRPRPGHADLAGTLKYDFKDMRNVLERSSARETAVRVAVGAFIKQFLVELDIQIGSHVIQIGDVFANREDIQDRIAQKDFSEKADKSPVRCLDPQAETEMKHLIDHSKSSGDTVGGVAQVIIRNLLPGLGSYIQWDRKLDSQLAAALVGIQAVKGIEIGLGFSGATRPGSKFHDEIFYEQKSINRKTNHAGGIEGGMSNGEDIVIQAMMKPIPTLMKPLASVDLKTKESFKAHKERSDITAVPALSVICEAVVAPVIANAVIDKFGGDTLDDIVNSYKAYKKRIEEV